MSQKIKQRRLERVDKPEEKKEIVEETLLVKLKTKGIDLLRKIKSK